MPTDILNCNGTTGALRPPSKPKKETRVICSIWDKRTEMWIALEVAKIITNLKEKGFNPTSGTADNFFRIYNRLCFKVNKKRNVEPTSGQRKIIDQLYPEIFPKNKPRPLTNQEFQAHF